MDLELAKTLHFRELDRRTQLDGAPTFRVAVLALLGGALSFYAERFTPMSPFLDALFVVSIALALFFASLSVAWLVKCYVGYLWGVLPPATKLKTYFDELRAYDATHGLEGTTPEKLFEAHLLQLLVEAAAANTINNNKRSDLIARATFCLVLATIFTLIAGIPLTYRAFTVFLQDHF